MPNLLRLCLGLASIHTMEPLPVLNEFARQILLPCADVNQPNSQVNVEEFKRVSEEFPIRFPIDSCRVKAQPAGRQPFIQQQIASAYPLIHERTLILYISFLEHKRKFGTAQEQLVYQSLSLVEFVQRLLSKRCVYFFDSSDSYCLLNGKCGSGGFEQIGSEQEKSPLLLQNVLSYDEIKLAALLYVSTYSEFINNGSRANAGRVEQNKSSIETEGVIIGMIGARFERENVMDCEDILITPEQNKLNRGYGFSSKQPATRRSDYRRVWREFYDEPKDFLYDEVKLDNKRFSLVGGAHNKFDSLLMKKRYAISFDALLMEAQARALAKGKPAYLHVVGFGLGVWKITEIQEQIFFEAFEECLRALGERLSHIGVVHFSWFHLEKWGSLYDGATLKVKNHPRGGIKIQISVRNPADKLKENMLPVVTYAWDGNALPGNEFWAGMLVSTGDPAAACSTLISELQNPHINKKYVSGENLHIASPEHGLIHIGAYARKVLDNVKK